MWSSITKGHQILLLVLLATLLFFGLRGGVSLYQYLRLSSFKAAQEMNWEIEEKGASEVMLIGTYAFEFEGRMFHGRAVLDPPLLNVYAAQDALMRYKEFTWQIWFNPSHPDETALQRFFPWKDLSYAAALSVLFLHFLFLGLFPGYKELTGTLSPRGRATLPSPTI
jgi:hypothetical protein